MIFLKPTQYAFYEVKIQSHHTNTYFRGSFLGETVIAGKGFIGFNDILDGSEISVPIENVASLRQVSLTIEEEKNNIKRQKLTTKNY